MPTQSCPSTAKQLQGRQKTFWTAVQAAVDERDPDILVCSTSQIIPTLHEMATNAGVDDFFAEPMARCRLSAARQPVDVFELWACGPLTGPIQRTRKSNHRRVKHVLLRRNEP